MLFIVIPNSLWWQNIYVIDSFFEQKALMARSRYGYSMGQHISKLRQHVQGLDILETINKHNSMASGKAHDPPTIPPRGPRSHLGRPATLGGRLA